jgi:hypothetical protein
LIKLRETILLLLLLFCFSPGFSQENEKPGLRILFRGLVLDASDLAPLPNTQIMVNRLFSSVSDHDGSFSFYANRSDTIVFRMLGYKQENLKLNDTLSGQEFIAGIYMQRDTMLIGEVVIIPRYVNLKSDILNSPNKTPATFDNARYNVAVSAYQGKTTAGKLGDAQDNYAALKQKQKISAFERGGIASENIAGLNPFILIPAAYLLLKGLPEKPPAYKTHISESEVDQINNAYLELQKQRGGKK